MKISKKIVITLILLAIILICGSLYKTFATSEDLTYKKLNNDITLISGFDVGTKVEEIISNNFSTDYTVKIFDKDNIEITNSENALIGTGCKIRLYSSNELEKEYLVVLYGDVNGDKSINSADALSIVKNKLGTITISSEEYIEAGRITESAKKNSEIPSAVDALAVIKYKLEPELNKISQKLPQIVTFNANGGSCSTTDKTVIYDATYGELPTPIREYTVTYNSNLGSLCENQISTYTFDGWFTEIADGTQVTSTTKVAVTEGQTLYAHWIPQNITLPTPTRIGYTFAGWYTDNELTTLAGAGGATYTPTENITLYAKWTENTYTVTCIDVVDSTDGTVLGSSELGTFSYGELVSAELAGEIKWMSTYYQNYYIVDFTEKIVTENTTVYRIFKEKGRVLVECSDEFLYGYSVSFGCGGGLREVVMDDVGCRVEGLKNYSIYFNFEVGGESSGEGELLFILQAIKLDEEGEYTDTIVEGRGVGTIEDGGSVNLSLPEDGRYILRLEVYGLGTPINSENGFIFNGYCYTRLQYLDIFDENGWGCDIIDSY